MPLNSASTLCVFQDALRPSSLTLPLADRIELPLPGVACDPAPRAGCRLPTVAGASPLVVSDHATADANDSFSWKWSKGTETAFVDLGDPATDDGFVFCVYDGSGAPLVLEAHAPAGGTCGMKSCWKQKGSMTDPKGWGYADKDATPDGIRNLKVQAGDAAKARARVKGKGENLGASSIGADHRACGRSCS